MTNKTEDRFYFGKPGQPERFGLEDACWEGYEPVGTKQKDGRTVPNCVPKDKNEQPEEFAKPQFRSVKLHNGYLRIDVNQGSGWERYDTTHEESFDGLEDYERGWEKAYSRGLRWSGGSWRIPTNKFSRLGQPERFDASSLDRGNFAEASKSPMLGKLLSAKVMPEGGWRAVQVGSDTLVISFEDADLARDFGRRASTRGYSATSPVATTGRYWNVEVKNGK